MTAVVPRRRNVVLWFLPPSAPVMLAFTFIWNVCFRALALVRRDSVRPVTDGLNSLMDHWLASWNLIPAGALVAAIPPVVLLFATQRHFTAGLTLGATRG